ncbi:hypothetical protein AB0C70_17450 [Streptomyces sp. NPDC048564]|uniref:hypothetical protein n=1 Tax=Streptomyces sp. NPDC048564 TaxID=3155760 RepID=UPI00344A5A56
MCPFPGDGHAGPDRTGPDRTGPGRATATAPCQQLYGVDGPTAFLVRPDGYLSARLSPLAAPGTVPALADALGRVFQLP